MCTKILSNGKNLIVRDFTVFDVRTYAMYREVNMKGFYQLLYSIALKTLLLSQISIYRSSAESCLQNYVLFCHFAVFC